MNRQKDYDSTVARIAANILSGLTRFGGDYDRHAVAWAVGIAREIVEETRRTESVSENPPPPEDIGGVAKRGI